MVAAAIAVADVVSVIARGSCAADGVWSAGAAQLDVIVELTSVDTAAADAAFVPTVRPTSHAAPPRP